MDFRMFSHFYQKVQHLEDILLIKPGPEIKFLFLFSEQAAPNPNLPHLLIDSNHLEFFSRSNLRVNMHYSDMKVCGEFGPSRFQKLES